MILSLSHYDLDGVSCQLVLDEYLGKTDMITKMNIGYNKIDEYINIIEDFCISQRPDSVYVTDLSFDIKQLTNLSEITKDFPYINFYFIDHHPIEDYKHLKSTNFHILVSKKASATKLVNLYIKNNFKNKKHLNISTIPELDTYVEFVNAYDIWLDETEEFKTGFIYNELFWSYGLKHFRSKFGSDYRLKDTDFNRFNKITNEKNELYNKIKTNNRMIELGNKDIFIIFIDDFNSHITIDFPDFKSYLIINSTGKASVRLKKLDNMQEIQDNIFKGLETLDNINNFGGHLGAFGIGLSDNSPDKLVKFAKEMMYILDESLNI